MPDDRSAIRSLLPVRPPLFAFRSTHRNHFRDCRTAGCGQGCLAWGLSPGGSHIDAQSSRESVLHGRVLAFRDPVFPQGLSAILDQQREVHLIENCRMMVGIPPLPQLAGCYPKDGEVYAGREVLRRELRSRLHQEVALRSWTATRQGTMPP
jgi:hypothetical protein